MALFPYTHFHTATRNIRAIVLAPAWEIGNRFGEIFTDKAFEETNKFIGFYLDLAKA
jgi:hypothetical protein